MNPVQIIATLRKLGNYLAGLFPFLASLADWIAAGIAKVFAGPLLMPIWQRLAKVPVINSLWKIFERFYWRTYSKDRLDLSEAADNGAEDLKPLFQLCALVCLLIPVCQLAIPVIAPMVPLETYAGLKGVVPAWSVSLWLFLLPAAWAALLIGTGLCNRVAFLSAALSCLFFLSTCLMDGPRTRSWTNALLGLTVVYALILCENHIAREKAGRYTRPLTVLLVSIAAGIEMTILTPLRPLVGTFIEPLNIVPKETIGLGTGTIIGLILSLFILRLKKAAPEEDKKDSKNHIWLCAFALFVMLLTSSIKSGLSQTAGQILNSLNQSNTYFWPVWYFIGLGIVHKLIGSSKVVAQALEGAVKPVLVKPLLISALLVSTVCALSDRLAFYFAVQKGEWAARLCQIFADIYHPVTPVFFTNAITRIGTHWLTWVLLLDLLLIALLALAKKLTNEVLFKLFYLTALSALLVWEYLFQYASFARTPSHNVVLVFIFASWLLWLMHTIGWSVSTKSSPLWPSRGRLAVYSGVVGLCLLEIFARASMQDYRVMNEIFLCMFRGVIEVGPAYYLYLWAGKHLKTLPVSVKSIFSNFCLGALTALLLNSLDKLSAASFRWSGFMALVQKQMDLLNNTGSINIDIDHGLLWFLLRAAIYVVVLSRIVALNYKNAGEKSVADKTLSSENKNCAAAFAALAAAGGVASFALTFVDLPLPLFWRVLTAPTSQELSFSCNVFNSFMSAYIPALIIAIPLLKSAKKTSKFASYFVALLAGFAIAFGYDQYQEYLRASGLIFYYTTLLGLFFAACVVYAMHILESRPKEKDSIEEASGIEASSTPATPSLSGSAKLKLIGALALCTAALALFQNTLQTTSVEVPPLHHAVEISNKWQENKSLSNGDTSVFTRSDSQGMFMAIGSVPSPQAGTISLARDLLVKAAQSGNFPELKVSQITPWEKYYPGALACFFSYNKDMAAGLTVLLPRGERTEFYTVCGAQTDMENLQWEEAFTIKKLKRRAIF